MCDADITLRQYPSGFLLLYLVSQVPLSSVIANLSCVKVPVFSHPLIIEKMVTLDPISIYNLNLDELSRCNLLKITQNLNQILG